jgi:hypothetical protein
LPGPPCPLTPGNGPVGPRDLKGQEDTPVYQVPKEKMGFQACRDLQVRKVQSEVLGPQDEMVWKDYPDLKE